MCCKTPTHQSSLALSWFGSLRRLRHQPPSFVLMRVSACSLPWAAEHGFWGITSCGSMNVDGASVEFNIRSLYQFVDGPTGGVNQPKMMHVIYGVPKFIAACCVYGKWSCRSPCGYSSAIKSPPPAATELLRRSRTSLSPSL